jgi:excisionase family DNA binding protein
LRFRLIKRRSIRSADASFLLVRVELPISDADKTFLFPSDWVRMDILSLYTRFSHFKCSIDRVMSVYRTPQSDIVVACLLCFCHGDDRQKSEGLPIGAEVAQLLRIRRAKVYWLIQRGEIPSVRMGRNVRIRQQDIEEYIRRCLQNPFGKMY